MKRLTALTGLLFSCFAAAQPNWSEDVAPLVYNKCASCHHAGGIAPFSLITYDEAASMAESMHQAVLSGHMPPWPADPEYRHFAHENVLTDDERMTFQDWVFYGTPAGNLADAPDPPVFLPGGSVLDVIDHTVAIEPYTLQTNTDEYRWFVVHTNFPQPVYISKIEVIPGLETVVHHADISYDMTGISAGYDDADPLSGFNSSTGAPNYDYYINAWQPGGNVAEYPPEWGVEIPPGADFVIEIHYGPGGVGLTDTTKFNLQFLPANVVSPRLVNVGWLLYDSPPCLVDGPLVIPANVERSFHQQSAPLSGPISIVSICPHMHMLGESYKVWAVTPTSDTIPLIDIPRWDFHWQKYYTYPSIQVLPAGTVIHSEGWYDNTVNNPHNPNWPPETVYKGPFTTDEMFLCYFIYTGYQPGDETIVLDSATWQLGTQDPMLPQVAVFPNPSNEAIRLTGLEGQNGVVIDLYDLQGTLLIREELSGEEAIDVRSLPSGMYVVRWKCEHSAGSERFVKD